MVLRVCLQSQFKKIPRQEVPRLNYLPRRLAIPPVLPDTTHTHTSRMAESGVSCACDHLGHSGWPPVGLSAQRKQRRDEERANLS